MCFIPLYDYKCINDQCEQIFETIHSMNDLPLAWCPYCNTQTTQRMIPESITVLNSTPKSLGSLAESNRKKLGEGEYQKRLSELKEQRRSVNAFSGKIPSGGSIVDRVPVEHGRDEVKLTKALNNASPGAIERYVMEGKKPFGA